MNVIYEPKLEFPAGAVPLGNFHAKQGIIPPDDFVVCRHKDGSVASVYGDHIWDFSAYDPEGRTSRLLFNFWGTGPTTVRRDRISREIRQVIFCLIWKRNAAPLSIGTLRNYLTVLCAIASYAEEKERALADVLDCDDMLFELVAGHFSGWMSETLGSLLSLLTRYHEGELGFEVVGEKAIRHLKRHNREYRSRLKQHAAIPTRIYSHILAGLRTELDDWLGVAADVLSALEACGRDPRMGRTLNQQRVIAKELGIPNNPLPTFEEVLESTAFAYIRHNSKPQNDTSWSVKSLSAVVGQAQAVVKLTVQAYTGMRDDEACSLPYDCLETESSNGKTHYIVKGRTTKFNNGLAKRTRWVTNQEAQRAIVAAQAIADVVYRLHCVSPKEVRTHTSGYPLFVSMAYAQLGSRPRKPPNGQFVPGTLDVRHYDRLPEKLLVSVDDSDISELEQIDPHRAWRAEKEFTVGQVWVLKTHQLRRSLALYAQRSGLVSLPSLRRQLQHLTEEMSRYYARGSAFATNFIGPHKDHFGKEWQATQPESAGLSYILNVLSCDDTLFGGHANWVQHRLKGADGVLLIDRETTMRRFKKGELAYKETLIGGCTNVDECDDVALKWLDIDCLSSGCKNMVCNLRKLERVIEAQEKLVSALDTTSVEYRTEKADLEVLIAARDKARLKQEGTVR